MPTSIQVDDGKYEFVIEENGGVVFRHGEAWFALTQATKAVIALIHEVVEARGFESAPEPFEEGLSRVRLDALRTSCEEKAVSAKLSGDVIGWLNAAECAHEALKRLPKVQP